MPGLGGIAPAVHRARAFTRKAPKPLPPTGSSHPAPRRKPKASWPDAELRGKLDSARLTGAATGGRARMTRGKLYGPTKVESERKPEAPPKPPAGPLGSPGPVAETAPGFLREPLPGYLRDVRVDPNGYVRNSKGQWVDARTRRIAPAFSLMCVTFTPLQAIKQTLPVYVLIFV